MRYDVDTHDRVEGGGHELKRASCVTQHDLDSIAGRRQDPVAPGALDELTIGLDADHKSARLPSQESGRSGLAAADVQQLRSWPQPQPRLYAVEFRSGRPSVLSDVDAVDLKPELRPDRPTEPM